MTASKIIFNALVMVDVMAQDGIFFGDDYLQIIANDCVEEIRNEFKKAGIDPWKEVKDEDPEEALHDQSKHPEE